MSSNTKQDETCSILGGSVGHDYSLSDTVHESFNSQLTFDNILEDDSTQIYSNHCHFLLLVSSPVTPGAEGDESDAEDEEDDEGDDAHLWG